SESPRAVMHATGCRRSIRAPIGAPPAPHWGGNWKEENEQREGSERNEDRSDLVARMERSEMRGGASSRRDPGLRFAPLVRRSPPSGEGGSGLRPGAVRHCELG